MASSPSVSALVAQYGYWMVLLGALAEGESVLLAAGFAAHRGLLQLPWVIAIAFVASSLGDQLCFYLGRRHGPRLLARFPSLQHKLERLQPLLQRHPNAAILSVRFLYGLRTAGPIALGVLGVPRWKFMLLNLASAALWASGFALLGYQFGNALQWWLKDLRAVEEGVLLVLLLAALALPLGWWLRRRAAA
jgi:membrane protein DedA with SNARE-associated domain